MNVLVLGSGGREHAIAWKISQSNQISDLYVAPGNAGTKLVGENVNISPVDFEAVKELVLEKKIALVIVGPEQPLVDGITDFFARDHELSNIKILGPVAASALLEGSKDFAKAFMKRHQIPTAKYRSFTRKDIQAAKDFLQVLKPPYVLKADGLAAGKGVLILEDIKEAEQALEDMLVDSKFGKASETVVIEEFLDGVECSVFALTDGRDYVVLPVAKDYKRAGEGDKGLNTGGMGCISPAPFADKEFMARVEERIISPTIKGLHEENLEYRGFLFFGLMNVDGDPYVIEYNVRLGDPEAQVVLPRIESDFLKLCYAAADGRLNEYDITIGSKQALAVIAASGGYPESYEKGKEISGIDKVKDALVFHAGTKQDDNRITTSGGRVLAVTALGNNLQEAGNLAYSELEKISFDKIYYRKDIGKDFLK